MVIFLLFASGVCSLTHGDTGKPPIYAARDLGIAGAMKLTP